jgi:hypothetical protein
MTVYRYRGSVEFASTDPQAGTATNPNAQTRMILDELEATTQAVLAADEADVRGAIESVHWERRGLLQSLTRVDRASRARHAHETAPTDRRPCPESAA